jgi:hypothetical protein
MTSEELAREITEITFNAEVDPDTIFKALQITFVFWMSCLCIDCRRTVADKLRADITKMLEGADKTATTFGNASTCH